MTSPEPVEIVVARLDERTRATAEDVADIKLHMATKNDQAHVDQRIAGLTGALEKETAERKAAIDAERKERVVDVNAVRSRLQVVEDRLEARKYHVGISIILAAVAAGLGVISVAFRPLFGG